MGIYLRRSSSFRSTPSAMETDAAALYWYEPNNVTLSGSDLTAWPDNTGNGMGLAQVGTVTVPTWNASDYAEFDGTQALSDATTGMSGRMMGELQGGGDAAVFAVIQMDAAAAAVAPFYPIVIENSSTSADYLSNTTLQLSIKVQSTSNTRFLWKCRNFSTNFECYETAKGDLRGTKLLLEGWADATGAELLINGVVEETDTLAGSYFNDTSLQIGLGAGVDGTSASSNKWDGNIFEVFATGDASSLNRTAIREELATKHGITL